MQKYLMAAVLLVSFAGAVLAAEVCGAASLAAEAVPEAQGAQAADTADPTSCQSGLR
jgi:hypothetical protein